MSVLSRQDIESIVSKFPNSFILVVGDLMLDRFLWGKVERISPEAPVPVVWVQRESVMPGGAANVARNITALGGQVVVAGVVGNDEMGQVLLDALSKDGVDVSSVVKDKMRPTTVKTRVIAHSQQVVRIDREKTDQISPDILEKLWEKIEKILPKVSAVIIEDYGKGVVNQFLLKRIVPLAHKLGKIITVDPKKDHFHLYKGVDVITPNLKELENAVGVNICDDRQMDKLARRLMKRLSLKGLLLTLSERGMKLYLPRKTYAIPTWAMEVYDVSGAGDTVIATFTLARSVGESPYTCAMLANLAAGVVVGKVGVAVCSPDELVKHSEMIMVGDYGKGCVGNNTCPI